MRHRARTLSWLLPGWLLLLLVALVVAAAIGRGRTPASGLVDGMLRGCPDAPNCVSSEATGTGLAPFTVPGTLPALQAWARLERLIVASGGRVVTRGDGYLHVVFHTRWLRFADDLELRMDDDAGVIHVRSGSRIGHSDLGANRKRVERLRALWERATDGG